MFLIGYLSLVRRIKARTLWSNSVLKWFFGFVGQLFRNLHAIWKVVLLFGVFAVIHWIAYISMGAVSYTHLDVYKRQVQHPAKTMVSLSRSSFR